MTTPQQVLSDEQMVAEIKACDKEDHTKEGWIWRTRIKWARAIEFTGAARRPLQRSVGRYGAPRSERKEPMNAQSNYFTDDDIREVASGYAWVNLNCPESYIAFARAILCRYKNSPLDPSEALLDACAESLFEADKRMWMSGPTFHDLHENDKMRLRTMASAVMALCQQPEVAEAEYWEWRYKESNPHAANFGSWSEWARVQDRSPLFTSEDALREIRQYIADGYKYELRALYARTE